MTQVHRLGRASVGVLAALILTHCGSGQELVHGDETGRVAVSVNAVGTSLATITIETSGGTPAVTTPLVSNLNVGTDGFATGVLELPPGQGRTIGAQARQSDGTVAYEGSITIDVLPGQNDPVSIPMVAKTGAVPVTIQFGDVSVTVTPAVRILTKGEILHVAVSVKAANGTAIRDTTTQPQWATSNSVVVDVDADTDGQGATLTAVSPGQAQVIASYAGIAGVSTIAVAGRDIGGGNHCGGTVSGGGGSIGNVATIVVSDATIVRDGTIGPIVGGGAIVSAATITIADGCGGPIFGGGGGASTEALAAVIATHLAGQTGMPVVLDASSSSDPSGQKLSFQWQVKVMPSTASTGIVGPDTANPVFFADTEGTYVLEVVVTAADCRTASATTEVVMTGPTARNLMDLLVVSP